MGINEMGSSAVVTGVESHAFIGWQIAVLQDLMQGQDFHSHITQNMAQNSVVGFFFFKSGQALCKGIFASAALGLKGRDFFKPPHRRSVSTE